MQARRVLKLVLEAVHTTPDDGISDDISFPFCVCPLCCEYINAKVPRDLY